MENKTAIINIDSKIYQGYGITSAISNLYNKIEELEGEMTPEIEEQLEINKENLNTVSVDFLKLRDILIGQVEQNAKEIQRLKELADYRVKQIEKVEKVMLFVLLTFGQEDKKGVKRLEFDNYILSTKRNPPSVEIVDAEKVPNEFKKFDFTIKNLTNDNLQNIVRIIENWNKQREELELDILETKQDVKISKKDLKVAIENNTDNLQYFNKLLANKEITEEIFHEKIQLIPELYAHIKEGAINLVIK